MTKSVLITGGAGFIASYVADNLLSRGYQVKALDNLDPQVHGPGCRRPDYLDPEVELIKGDVRDPAVMARALKPADAVFHFAARVGVGQSMYAMADYTAVNNLGTAVLLEALRERHRQRPVEKLVVASSMSVYGEGLYVGEDNRPVTGAARTLDQLRRGVWEPSRQDGGALLPVATPEGKPPSLSSVYALSKFDQERMCLLIGEAAGVPTVALRFFNVYGPRQALSNPYTGVLAIFAARLLNGNRPLIFEDGRQRRDFIHALDVAEACRLALEAPSATGGAINIGSGRSYTVIEIARQLAATLGSDIEPEVTGQYRVGDIRHCFADISAAQSLLGFQPRVGLAEGIETLADWLAGETAVDRVAEMRADLMARGLAL